MPDSDITPGVYTSRLFRIKGQKSNWFYGDTRIQPEDAEVLRDINLSERGTADSRYGYDEYNVTQLSDAAAIVGLHQETFSTNGTQTIIVTPTKIYTDNGTTFKDITPVAGNLSGGNDDRVRFAFLDDKVFINNGVDQVQTWAGDYTTPTKATALTGMPWTKCKDFLTHRGLGFALAPTEGGVLYPTRIRWSDINTQTFTADTSTWPETNRFEVEDTGTPIVGGVDNFGKLWVFKEDGVYPGYLEFSVGFIEYRPLAPLRGFSPVAKCAFINRPEFIFGVAEEGPFVIRPDDSIEWPMRDNQIDWDGFSQTRLQYAQSFIREREHQVRTLLSSANNTSGHDRILVWDWETGSIDIDEPTDTLNYVNRIVLSGQEFDWFGDMNGYTYKANDPDKSDDNGTSFQWRVKLTPNDLGLPGREKLIQKIRTYYRRRTGQSNVTLQVYRNQGDLGTRETTLNIAALYQWNASGIQWNTGLKCPGGSWGKEDFWVNRMAETVSVNWEGTGPIALIGFDCVYEIME